MTTLSYPALDECIQTAVLENGLRIFGIPRAQGHKSFAMLAADFGSIDCCFTLDGQTHRVTPGIAHFLEHKMFEEADGNALQKFTALGAQPNAFTSHTMTAYHFTCTDRFYENLEILLHLVSTPYFTERNVEKEKGIIGQEIGMLDDTPSWRAYVAVLQGLYGVHPVRISVAGSRESIAPIDPEVLHLCYRAFYSPNNLALIVCGQYDFDRVTHMAQRLTQQEAACIAARDYGEEPREAAQPCIELNMAVSRPLFMLGCKDTVPQQPYERQLIGELAVSCVCGPSTRLYDKLYRAGYIDQSFDPDYFTFPGGACAIFSGESRAPEAVQRALEAELTRIAADGLDAAVFDRVKRAAYGRFIRRMGEPSEVCRMQAEACFSGRQCFDFKQVLEDVTAEAVCARIRELAAPQTHALAVIRPQEETA